MNANPRAFAEMWHGTQRYGSDPYVVHLDEVVGVMEQMIAADLSWELWKETLITAAYLHDVLEDTTCTELEISNAFTPLVAKIVRLVTDPEGLPNRKARKTAMIDRLAACFVRGERIPGTMAVAVKLADRIANVRRCRRSNPSLLSMYRLEQAEFTRLRDASPSTNMYLWGVLDEALRADTGSSS